MVHLLKIVDLLHNHSDNYTIIVCLSENYAVGLMNSDQGSQYTSHEYLTLWQARPTTQISMDGGGRAMDNIFTERFWRTLKYEEVYLKVYASVRDAMRSISAYITFYNRERPHQSLGYKIPATLYSGKQKGLTAAVNTNTSVALNLST